MYKITSCILIMKLFLFICFLCQSLCILHPHNHKTDFDEVPPKHRFSQDPHTITPQKMVFFIVTAVKTSNPT
jgi:hypothetical protein